MANLTKDKIHKLLELIEEVVNCDEPWREKAAIITTEADAGSDSGVALEEFASWFGEGINASKAS